MYSLEGVKRGDISVDTTRIMPKLAALLEMELGHSKKSSGPYRDRPVCQWGCDSVVCIVLFFILLGSRMEFVSPQRYSTRTRLM